MTFNNESKKIILIKQEISNLEKKKMYEYHLRAQGNLETFLTGAHIPK